MSTMRAVSDLASSVCSITPTQRRRFFWAAWWTHSPQYTPFQRPDASNGGARSEAEALKEAEKIAGRHLTVVEPHWARAWNRVLRGDVPEPPPAREAPPTSRARPETLSAWEVLGLAPDSDAAEIKRAYRRRALETHPDRGGSEAAFVRVQRAYDKLAKGARARPKRRA